MSESRLLKPKRFHREVENIDNKLKELESGRIYEITGDKMDGDLASNIVQLRMMINSLIQRMDSM
jgi:hypothetical protein